MFLKSSLIYEIQKFYVDFIVFASGILGDDSSYEKYNKLKLENCLSIKKEDLPKEFGENAVKTVDKFVKKTFHLDYECLLYFDYVMEIDYDDIFQILVVKIFQNQF